MKKLFCFLGCILIFTNLKAQPKAEIGGFLGTSYYLGDINPSRHFYSMQLSGGAIYKYNINNRFTIRLSALAVQLKAKDADFTDAYRLSRNYSLDKMIIEAGTQLEINFLPFILSKVKDRFTPYMLVGLAGFSMHSSQASSFQICLPLGIGVKLALDDRFEIGLEYALRKTFTAYLDGIDSKTQFAFSPKQNSSILNNDWYFLSGVVLTYRFFNGQIACRAYKYN